MSIDERLEALTHAVELIAPMQLKTEKEIRQLGRYVRIIALDHEARLLALETDEGDGDKRRLLDLPRLEVMHGCTAGTAGYSGLPGV